jgi:2-polyprenyl-3-methyl-5-hydroxy-6-metoxy-1,4-benzoquinol methylase
MSEFALFEDIVCKACGSSSAPDEIGRVYDHEYRSVDIEFRVVQCGECGLVYLKPRPDARELDRIYPKSYYSYHLGANSPEPGTPPSFVQRLFQQRNQKALSEKLALSGFKAGTLTRPVRVLDVGCGVGVQLDMFKALLPSAELHGVEIGELAVRKTRAKGHTAYHGRFEDIDLPKDYFDIVYSSHVIEHVEDPLGFLAKCHSVSSPEAIIIIETPNTDCVEFEFLRARHWGGYHAPRHFYLFNPKNMTTMAARTGLSGIVARSYPSPAFWNWTCHSFLAKLVSYRIADAVFPPVTIFYGGIRSFILLGGFSVLESFILKLTGRASAFWIAFSKT